MKTDHTLIELEARLARDIGQTERQRLADQEQSTSDQAEAERQLIVGRAGIETYRNALIVLAKR
jgi:hypothetical protein